ncbi:MAG: helix-turn-helix transcriptional regulator [Clostridia bacterium]|nr:helix-turn-helix transcriptional regulator [Clostridia bacterium]
MQEVIFPDGMILNCLIKKTVEEQMHSHHYHDKLELYYMVNGSCSYFIDNKTYEVVAGDLVILPPGIIHRTNYIGEDHVRIVVECSDHFIPAPVLEKVNSLPPLLRSPSVSKEIYMLLKRIDDEFKSPDEYSAESLKARMSALFILIARNAGATGAISSKNEMIDEIIDYIKSNFQQDIKLSRVAKNYFISPEHLSRTFKRDTGFGFNEFLTIVRLKHAENLLKNRGGKSISEIAYSCGFNDSNYFSDKFRHAYGVSPLKFSKRHELGEKNGY